MRVAIITMSYGINYGNRLQNYALQELLKTQNVESETIHFIKHKHGFVSALIYKAKLVVKYFLGYRLSRSERLRKKKFDEFNNQYIKWGKYSFYLDFAPSDLIDYYDFFIVGSDQVWNTNFGDIRGNIHIFLEAFAPEHKRIAYAASFGRKNIDPDYLLVFLTELAKFKAISVREKEGVALVEKCGNEATVVLDPTMMIDNKKWDKIANKPRYIKEKPFVVTYFLGGRNPKMVEYIEELSNGRDVVNLESESVPEEAIVDIYHYMTPPEEFIWLISNADYVLTDSFHATVFSIIYHRPFQVFDRIIDGNLSGMENRIDTLLSTFGLEKCKGDLFAPKDIVETYEWEMIDAILQREREKSLKFLKNSLGIN